MSGDRHDVMTCIFCPYGFESGDGHVMECILWSCECVPTPSYRTHRVVSCLSYFFVLFLISFRVLRSLLASLRQARDVDESRYMYDQLAVLSPVMLALTAATPILKGRLVDTDVRWNTIATSVDDRTPAERGLLDHDAVSAAVSQKLCLVLVLVLVLLSYDGVTFSWWLV